LRSSLPELPDAREARFRQEYGLSAYEAALLTESRQSADYFETASRRCNNPGATANWILGDLARLLNAENRDLSASPVSPDNLAGLIQLLDHGVISGKIAKSLLEEMYNTSRDATSIVEERDWKTVTDVDALSAMVAQVLQANPAIAADIRERGLVQKRGYLIGQIMKLSAGKAEPAMVNRLLDEQLAQDGAENAPRTSIH
ncbi:MAG TPA: Asp-tRNA(Asn)/Glu-tRNA(Gln) amidotransferase GatCAB subunit B, partial [Chthonomonadales bacterium]|nr:Asp-tRNA(Asn)/Glu-tRNA(Gln) amidotransferase GatCAB subunit B [Chthonomonadales bacterium]